MSLYTLELESGYNVQVEYEYNEPELGYDGTGYRGGVNVHAVWAHLKDKNEKLITVDVLHFLNSISEEFDIQDLEEHIEQELKDGSNEPDPDRFRDDV
tara:strand:+ start:1233 stop:1526 length:294 start_codon:yes stop_codon:yes gene_type:complete